MPACAGGICRADRDPLLGVSHKGRRGEGLFFVDSLPNGEPDRRTVHAGRPPTRGEKWVVSQFMRGRPMF